jgi:hypothetical protein
MTFEWGLEGTTLRDGAGAVMETMACMSSRKYRCFGYWLMVLQVSPGLIIIRQLSRKEHVTPFPTT